MPRLFIKVFRNLQVGGLSIIFAGWFGKGRMVFVKVCAENLLLMVSNQIANNHPENGKSHYQFDNPGGIFLFHTFD